MRNLLLATCIVLMTSFCTKEAPTATCGADYDWSGIGVPGFQGNCYLVTNAQIKWMQENGRLQTENAAPNNNQCPTKAQFVNYVGSVFMSSDEFTALQDNQCVPIGYFFDAL